MRIRTRSSIVGVVIFALAGCTPAAEPRPAADPPPAAPVVSSPPAPTASPTPTAAPLPAASPAVAVPSPAETHCTPSPRMPVADRASPYDSTRFTVDGAEALVCYGRPAARGRTMIGGEAVPFGKLWRTGANEPTIVHLPVAARVAGVPLDAGSYSLYTIPGASEWTVILNRSTSQWGHEARYTDEIRAQEVGRATVAAERAPSPVESFTIRALPAEDGAQDLLLEWETTRVRIPVAPAAR